MATISKGILGGFSGKVGTVVGVSWRGKDIIRSRPKVTQRTPTDNQLLQQMKFTLVMRFLQPLKTIQTKYFGVKNGARSRANMAASYNLQEAITVNRNIPELVFNKVLITKGDLTGFQNITITPQAGRILRMTWGDNSTQGNAADTDLVTLVCYCSNLGSFDVQEDLAVRSDLTINAVLPALYAGKEVQTWAYLHNEKQTVACNSSYLGAHTLM